MVTREIEIVMEIIALKTIREVLKYFKYGVLLTVFFLLIYAVFGWTGIIVVGAVLGVLILFLGVICLMLYGFGRSFSYTDKEIGKELKGFLGYDFGKKYEVLANETRMHGDRPVHFVIRIPKEAMKGVEDFCRTECPSGCTPERFEKKKEYKDDKIDYVVRNECMTINFNDCTIDFSGASC